MSELTRRDLLLSGASFPPLAHLNRLPAVSPQDTVSEPLSQQPPISRDLVNYASDALGRLHAKRHAQTLSQDDYQQVSKTLHVLADHFSDTGVDSALSTYAKAQLASPSPMVGTEQFPMDEAFSHVRKFEPSLKQEDLSFPSHFSVDSVSVTAGLTMMSSQGLSNVLHELAEHYVWRGNNLSTHVSELNPTEMPAHLVLGAYRRQNEPHFRLVCTVTKLSQLTPQQVCQLGIAIAAAIAAGLLGIVCAAGLLAIGPTIIGAVVLAIVCAAAGAGLAVLFLLLAAYGC